MKFGSKKAIFGGVLRGLDLVWESATPPTHIWERSPKKKRFFFLAAPLTLVKIPKEYFTGVTLAIGDN